MENSVLVGSRQCMNVWQQGGKKEEVRVEYALTLVGWLSYLTDTRDNPALAYYPSLSSVNPRLLRLRSTRAPSHGGRRRWAGWTGLDGPVVATD